MESRHDRPASGSGSSAGGSAAGGSLARRPSSPLVPQRGRDGGNSLNPEEEMLAKWIMEAMGKGRASPLRG